MFEIVDSEQIIKELREEIARLKSLIKRYEEQDLSDGLFYSSISTDMLCQMLSVELKTQVHNSYGNAEKLFIVETVKNKVSEIARLQSALDVAVEGLEKYRQTVVGSYAEATLDKIKQIKGN